MEPDGEQKKDVSADSLDGAKETAKEHVKESVKEDAPAAGNKLLLSLKRLLHATVSLLQRLRQLLQAGVVRILDAGSGLLQRLRKRAAEPGAEKASDDERRAARPESHAKAKPREDHAKEAPPNEAAVPAPHSAV
ncbi:MAG: hypothetical protein NTY41_01760, partial [Proteobacteria bacterium]|nr:hypothetical protein [Pseudomonadota bacterium]